MNLGKKKGCLPIDEAEKKINAYAREQRDDLELVFTRHANWRREKRDITTPDTLHVLAYGYVEGEPEESTRPDCCKYKICGRTPNSGNREIALVVIPDPNKPAIKIVTAMWKDL